jgi:hypothetical protein
MNDPELTGQVLKHTGRLPPGGLPMISDECVIRVDRVKQAIDQPAGSER